MEKVNVSLYFIWVCLLVFQAVSIWNLQTGFGNYFYVCMCRFSSFAKTGGEAFLMGQVDVSVPESDRIKIIVRFHYGFHAPRSIG